jgi:hypothetical protein
MHLLFLSPIRVTFQAILVAITLKRKQSVRCVQTVMPMAQCLLRLCITLVQTVDIFKLQCPLETISLNYLLCNDHLRSRAPLARVVWAPARETVYIYGDIRVGD